MLCIELSRNGRPLATGGLPGKGVLSVIFDRVLSDAHGPQEGRHFSFGGLDTASIPQYSLSWAHGSVDVGDEFTVRFLERDTADAPRCRSPSRPRSKASARRAHLKHLRWLEQEAVSLRRELGLERRTTSGRRRRRDGTRRQRSAE